MIAMKKLSILVAFAAFSASCGTTSSLTRGDQYEKMYGEKPLTLLVMPPINNTSNVEAKDLLYTSISKPLAEAGYYVISPFLAMDVLKAESAYDAELFIDADLAPFANYFGCDAVIFSQIDSWTKKGFGIQTKIRYLIKSVRTREILFDRSCDLYLDLQQNSGTGGAIGALVDLAASVIATAATNHIIAARKCNAYIFNDVPRGKYSPEHLKDKDVRAAKKDIVARVK